MGTGAPGRYLSTKGGRRSVSQSAQVHSFEGTFIKSRTKVDGKTVFRLRLKSGGHGQKGMELLEKYNITYKVVKIYPNGVRIGHVANHVDPRKRQGVGQTWFPEKWTEKDIKRAGTHVAGLKKNRNSNGNDIIFGNYKGVRVGVIRQGGIIMTVFPDRKQPKRKGPS